MGMRDILKCRLCGSTPYKNHICDLTDETFKLQSFSIDGGVLGKINVDEFIDMHKGEYYITTEVIRLADNHLIMRQSTTISNCPFCGRELD